MVAARFSRRGGAEPPLEQTVNVLAVAPGVDDELYLLYTIYDPRNAIDAGGQILRVSRDREDRGEPTLLLSVADSLSCLWRSPVGHLWTASSDGNLYTSAPVRFPPPIDVRAMNAPLDGFRWQATTLPAGRRGHAPLAQAIWGNSDNDVFVAGGDGSIAHWNGERWEQQDTPVSSELIAFAGYGPLDVWCVGAQAVVLHYDGVSWRQVAVPRVHPTDIFSNVSCFQGGILACTVQGSIVQGGGDRGLSVRAQEPAAKWWGVVPFGNAILLADSRLGAWTLREESLTVFREGFLPVDLFAAEDRLFFVESNQPQPSLVEYLPAANAPWGRHSF